MTRPGADELDRAERELESLLRKCEAARQRGTLSPSRQTLMTNRVAALRTALALVADARSADEAPGTAARVLADLPVQDGTVVLREAVRDDVPAIVDLLVDDPLGAHRDGATAAAGLEPYWDAFALVDADPAHLLLVATDEDAVVATMQLSFVPGLARRGALRAQIEAVRVRQDHRGGGLGAAMFAWAIDESRRRGCGLVQLTTDKARADAHRFYERLGFVASHEGLKLTL